ncbi:hypothetical protein LAZ67_8003795 [Cordylochernes scorpioides]|uniref:Transposase n=1 Tax=Cordylochernes scorpioides TaxID=51811 RepID=A0ABY6KRV7_9ARAC|nr:hypothetical protein LAZ67_8003795 [Cordylochernes scorpioides]
MFLRSQGSAGKVLLTIFWDVDGPICLDFLSSRQRMNSDLYCDILVNKLKPGIRNKRRGKLSKEHPAYSPDLAPSDYFLFGLLKKELKGKRFDSDEDDQKVVQDFFHTLPKSAYKEGIYKLPERWRRCIQSQGDYFELDEWPGQRPGFTRTITLKDITVTFIEDTREITKCEKKKTDDRHWPKISRYGWTLMPHPAYSPDLTPSDFYLFGKLKISLRGRTFENDEMLLHEVRGWFRKQDVAFYQSCELERTLDQMCTEWIY